MRSPVTRMDLLNKKSLLATIRDIGFVAGCNLFVSTRERTHTVPLISREGENNNVVANYARKIYQISVSYQKTFYI